MNLDATQQDEETEGGKRVREEGGRERIRKRRRERERGRAE